MEISLPVSASHSLNVASGSGKKRNQFGSRLLGTNLCVPRVQVPELRAILAQCGESLRSGGTRAPSCSCPTVETLHSVRAELEGRGVSVANGSWGYPLMVVHDPDGNELYFPYPADGAAE
jgi:hypothetical protein